MKVKLQPSETMGMSFVFIIQEPGRLLNWTKHHWALAGITPTTHTKMIVTSNNVGRGLERL